MLALTTSAVYAQSKEEFTGPYPNPPEEAYQPAHRVQKSGIKRVLSRSRSRIYKPEKQNVRHTAQYEFYKRVELAAKEKQRVMRKLAKPQYSNFSYYGRALTMGDILFDRAVKPTASVAELARKLSAPESTLEVEIATASTPATTVASTNVAVEQLHLLLEDLNEQKQTSALKHLNGYLSAMITSQQTADADMTVTILERIRAGRTAEAIELLEFQLDGSVIGLADSLTVKTKLERPAGALKAVQRARA